MKWTGPVSKRYRRANAWEMHEQSSGVDEVETPVCTPLWREGEAAGTGEPLSITGSYRLALGTPVILSDSSIQLLPFTTPDTQFIIATLLRAFQQT